MLESRWFLLKENLSRTKIGPISESGLFLTGGGGGDSVSPSIVWLLLDKKTGKNQAEVY
jgi:hypothetical protein